MMTVIRAAIAILLAVCLTAGMAGAQCAFEHPKKAKGLQARLTQAMVSCGNPGGNTPNTTTETGTIPSCAPPETYNEEDGSPPNGWVWGPSSFGSVKLKSSKNKVVDPLNPLANSRDLAVSMKLKQIFDANGAVADAPGTLSIILRMTFNDRMGGDMTVIDYPFNFPFTIAGGQVSLKTSVNVILNGMGMAGLPGCTSIEILSVHVLDENGNLFANLGTFMPEL